MYQTLKNLGIVPIKCQNKQGTDDLKEIHYAVNELLFKYQFTYLSPQMARYLIKKLNTANDSIRNLKLPESAKAKGNEVFKVIRDYAAKLVDYATVTPVEPPIDEKVIKLRVADFLKKKDKGFSYDAALAYAKENWLISQCYKAEVPSFNAAQDELIKILKTDLELLRIR